MYIPSDKILNNYAKVLINFALNSGKGVKENELVFFSLNESAKPMILPIQKAILEAGAHMILQYLPEGTQRSFFELASNKQLEFTPKEYLLERIKCADHFVSMLSENDLHELEGIDSQRIMTRNKAFKYYMDARDEKERAGKFTWTLGLFGTQAMADEAKLSLEEYWQQIIDACFLEFEDPIQKWKDIFSQIEVYRNKLNDLSIDKIYVKGEDIDLEILLGEKREWIGGSGRNIPSFEIFTSPDWRGTNGKIKFNQPLYRYGSLITGIELEFKDGRVIYSKAATNEKLLKDMIAVENADRIGEFSLTDKRFSKITKFMANTLYDENIGGEFGNTHIALGRAYTDCCSLEQSEITKEVLDKLGFNDSVIHTDIMSTTDRTVSAKLKDGSIIEIYKNGEFTL